MSQVPPQASPPERQRFEILATPDVSPLGQLFLHLRNPGIIPAVLVLRNVVTSEEVAAIVVRLASVEHDPLQGVVTFGGTLQDGRHIEAYIFNTPEPDNAEVAGRAVIDPIE